MLNIPLLNKNILLVVTFVFIQLSSIAQSESPIKMHRIQDTTKDSSGLFYGKSTEGHFSVLLPIPFNDFTIEGEDAAMYIIGSQGQDGIKFSVTEIVKKEKNKAIDLDALLKVFDSPENTIENSRKEKIKDAQSISFSVFDKSKGAIIKHVDSKNSIFTMIIEFPIEQRKTVEREFGYFFSSLILWN